MQGQSLSEHPYTVNVLYNDALCTDNREVTTNFPGTILLH